MIEDGVSRSSNCHSSYVDKNFATTRHCSGLCRRRVPQPAAKLLKNSIAVTDRGDRHE